MNNHILFHSKIDTPLIPYRTNTEHRNNYTVAKTFLIFCYTATLTFTKFYFATKHIIIKHLTKTTIVVFFGSLYKRHIIVKDCEELMDVILPFHCVLVHRDAADFQVFSNVIKAAPDIF